MTDLQRIELITSISNYAVTDYKQRWAGKISFTYFTISDVNDVRVFTNAVSSVHPNIKYTFICICLHYQHYGYRIDIEPLSVIDQIGNILSDMTLGLWCMSGLKFEANHYSQSRTVLGAKFNVNNNIESKFSISLEIKDQFTFQELWNFFIELDAHCKSPEEGNIYFDYFLQRRKAEQNILTIEEYKSEIKDKSDMIKSYEALLRKIESLITI